MDISWYLYLPLKMGDFYHNDLHPFFWGGKYQETPNHLQQLTGPRIFLRTSNLPSFEPLQHHKNLRGPPPLGCHLHSWKLTWHWQIPIFNRKYIFKWWMFSCHVSFREGNLGNFAFHTSLTWMFKKRHFWVLHFKLPFWGVFLLAGEGRGLNCLMDWLKNGLKNWLTCSTSKIRLAWWLLFILTNSAEKSRGKYPKWYKWF